MADEAPPTVFRFECAAFGDVEIVVDGAHVAEALDEPYTAVVDLLATGPELDFTQLIGQDAVLTFTRAGVERRVVGLLREVRQGEGADGARQVTRATLAPAAYLLSFRRDTRMFQEMTVPEILEAVLSAGLEPYGRSFAQRLQATYAPREYCLQYQESDLDFVQRLMEEEGIAYHFEHSGDAEEMVLTDANAAFEAASTSTVTFQPHTHAAVDEHAVHRFEVTLRDTTTSITVNDHDWTRSATRLEAKAEGEDALGRVRESYEHGIGRQLQIGSYDQGVRRYQKDDATRQAPLRKEAAVHGALLASGMGRAVGFRPGTHFTLTGHPGLGVDGDYLVTRVEHLRAVPPEHAGVGETDLYHNRFECSPLAAPYRPRRRTHKPRIDGVEPAIVTGPSGEEIHVDEHGRIKVQFAWDRESPADETSSCWLRVKQEWAGPSWGFWWVPRIGMEVVVHFIDGDPDRPLVTGGTYNAENATPYPLPDEKTKSTIKSDSSLGHSGFSGQGFNELRFEDKAGSEEIFTHAEKDYNEVVENDHDTLVHHDQTITVDNNQTQTIGANQTERVDATQTMTVGANRTVHVKGNYDETVDGTETRNTVGDVTETFAANESRTIGASITEDIGANETRNIGASQSETFGADQTQSITGNSQLTIAAGLNRTVTGGITTTTPATQDVDVGGSWTVTTTGAITMIAAGGTTLTFPGGVQRADSFWGTTVSSHETTMGNVELETFGMKTGLAILASGIWVTKIDLHANEEAANVLAMYIEGVKVKQRAALEKAMEGCDIEFDAAKIIP